MTTTCFNKAEQQDTTVIAEQTSASERRQARGHLARQHELARTKAATTLCNSAWQRGCRTSSPGRRGAHTQTSRSDELSSGVVPPGPSGGTSSVDSCRRRLRPHRRRRRGWRGRRETARFHIHRSAAARLAPRSAQQPAPAGQAFAGRCRHCPLEQAARSARCSDLAYEKRHEAGGVEVSGCAGNSW
jgi:hypothetical protein